MSSGKREFREQKGKKLNILKVLIVIILIIVVIVGIISLIKYINKDTNLEEKKEELETSLENNNSVEEKSIEDEDLTLKTLAELKQVAKKRGLNKNEVYMECVEND